jgi:hypothetical protein
MDRDPNQTALREARRVQRLGQSAEVCVICGEPVLKVVSKTFAQTHGIPRSLIEQHHIVGRRRDSGFVVPLCLTHHWKATVGLLREGVDMVRERVPHILIAQCLRAVAMFLEMLAPAMRKWADILEEGQE